MKLTPETNNRMVVTLMYEPTGRTLLHAVNVGREPAHGIAETWKSFIRQSDAASISIDAVDFRQRRRAWLRRLFAYHPKGIGLAMYL